MEPRVLARAGRGVTRRLARRVATEAAWVASRRGAADIALFHEFEPPPTGGGHQFLRALAGELAGRGVDVEQNRISAGTIRCLFNSFNFDFARLRRFARPDCRLVHRVDGPVGVYRGFDDGTDARIAALNRELADATVFQSRYSLERHRELGFELAEPVVVPNAVDPAIFYPPPSREPLEERRARVIATSWSDNPRKGADTLAWLDGRLDTSRYEVTFVGRHAGRLERIRTAGALPSGRLAELLRAHDAYLAPSRDDPSSNALLEALACGLPAVFRDSGGHPELVGAAGVPFRDDEELPDALERLVNEIDARRAAISVPAISDVADRYLEVLGL